MSKLNKTCPLCGATDYSIKHGKDTKNRQRFLCKSCNKSYIKDSSRLCWLLVSQLHNLKRKNNM